MHRSFSYTLLITWFLFAISCKTNFVIKDQQARNTLISEEINLIDSQIVSLYLPYKNILDKDMNRVISISEIEMIKDKPESALTNFLADLLLNEGTTEAQQAGNSFTPQISYFNYGGIRTSLPKGEITVGKIFELMPFENEMVFVQLDGTQVQQFLNVIAEKGGDSVGGVRFIISGKEAIDVMVSGEKFNINNNYWIVTNDYIANGGDGMDVFSHKLQMINSGKKIRDVIISYMEEKQKDGSVLNAKLDGRIINE